AEPVAEEAGVEGRALRMPAHEVLLTLDRFGEHLEERGAAHALAFLGRAAVLEQLEQPVHAALQARAALDLAEDPAHVLGAADELAQALEKGGELLAALAAAEAARDGREHLHDVEGLLDVVAD